MTGILSESRHYFRWYTGAIQAAEGTRNYPFYRLFTARKKITGIITSRLRCAGEEQVTLLRFAAASLVCIAAPPLRFAQSLLRFASLRSGSAASLRSEPPLRSAACDGQGVQPISGSPFKKGF